MKSLSEVTDACWVATHVFRRSRTRFTAKDPGTDGKDKYFTATFSWDTGHPVLRIKKNGKLTVNAAVNHEELASCDISDVSMQSVIFGVSDYSLSNGVTTTIKVKFDAPVSASSFLKYYNTLSLQKKSRYDALMKGKSGKTKLPMKSSTRPPLVSKSCITTITSHRATSTLRPDLDKEITQAASDSSVAIGKLKKTSVKI